MDSHLGLAAYQVENAVKVTAAMGAYLNGRVDEIIGLCSDDIVWRSVAKPIHAPFGGVYYGRTGVRRFFDNMFGAFDILKPRVLDVIPAGDEVLHILKLEAAKKDGSAEGAAFVVGRWAFRNGLAVAYTDYFNVPASIQTSHHDYKRTGASVTRDPSFDVYKTENAVRISEILAAYGAGNMGPLFASLHPEVAWRSLSEPQHARFGGLFRGPEAVKTYLRRLGETLVLDDYSVVDVIPAGDEVFHVAEVKAHSIGTPQRKIYMRLVCVWTFDGDRITAMSEYFDVPAYWTQLNAK